MWRMPVFEYIAIACVIGVAVVLAMGVINMVTGSEFGKRNSNRLMRLRIALQAAAVLFLALAYLTGD